MSNLDQTLTLGFLLARLIKQAFSKKNVDFVSLLYDGINATCNQTKNLLILEKSFAISKIYTPIGELSAIGSICFDCKEEKEIDQTNQEILDKVQAIQIIPEYTSKYGNFGPYYLVTSFKYGDFEFQANPEDVERVKSSKFHTMSSVNCSKHENFDLLEEMNKHFASFQKEVFIPHQEAKQIWLQHLKLWFEMGFLSNKLNLTDENVDEYIVSNLPTRLGLLNKNFYEKLFYVVFRQNLENDLEF